WGPEQQILTPAWRQGCRRLGDLGFEHLVVSVLGPLDIIVSKMARADEIDLEDMRYLIAHESLAPDVVRRAMDEASIPEILRDAYGESRPRVEALLREIEAG